MDTGKHPSKPESPISSTPPPLLKFSVGSLLDELTEVQSKAEGLLKRLDRFEADLQGLGLEVNVKTNQSKG